LSELQTWRSEDFDPSNLGVGQNVCLFCKLKTLAKYFVFLFAFYKAGPNLWSKAVDNFNEKYLWYNILALFMEARYVII
jgi:hypothetical protein